jgi:hypothetical protein
MEQQEGLIRECKKNSKLFFLSIIPEIWFFINNQVNSVVADLRQLFLPYFPKDR